MNLSKVGKASGRFPSLGVSQSAMRSKKQWIPASESLIASRGRLMTKMLFRIEEPLNRQTEMLATNFGVPWFHSWLSSILSRKELWGDVRGLYRSSNLHRFALFVRNRIINIGTTGGSQTTMVWPGLDDGSSALQQKERTSGPIREPVSCIDEVKWSALVLTWRHLPNRRNLSGGFAVVDKILRTLLTEIIDDNRVF